MKSKHYTLLLLCMLQLYTYAQITTPKLNIGNAAPPLRVGKWLKGTPFKQLENGKVYVFEFWATWCLPCRVAMPHLSELAEEYKDKVIFTGIDVFEQKNTTLQNLQHFVDSMGSRMGYNVVTEIKNQTVNDWLMAADEGDGIPNTFIVNGDGKIAWIGHPFNIDSVLQKVVNGTWDIKQARAKRNTNRYLAALDLSEARKLNKYAGNAAMGDMGRPDSALLLVKKLVAREPRLQYAPHVGYHTFCALLKTNQPAAVSYGKILLATTTYEAPAYSTIYDAINWHTDKITLSPDVYLLGAESLQLKLDHMQHPELYTLYWYYQKMAECYWHAHDKEKAIATQEKAIELLKKETLRAEIELPKLEEELKEYRKG